MATDLSFDLHALTARLNRSADRILQSEYGLSYRRFLTLWTVHELGSTTQRALAAKQGISEPSASRMTAVLVEMGLLDSQADHVGGNRRRLTLTTKGQHLVEDCRELLEHRFAELVTRCGVSYADYARDTRLLIAALDAPQTQKKHGKPPGSSTPPTRLTSETRGR